MTSTLEQLQLAVASMLIADSVFGGAQSTNGKSIPVVTEKKADLISYITQQINALGLGVLVLTPTLRIQEPKQLVRNLNALCSIWIQVSENPTINQSKSGTGISAATLAVRVIEVLQNKEHNVQDGLSMGHQTMLLQNVQIAATDPNKPTKSITYNLIFSTKLVLKTI